MVRGIPKCTQTRSKKSLAISLAMMFFGLLIGFVLQLTHGNYVPVFLLAGSAYLVAIAVIQLLAPKLAVIAID